MLPAPHLDGIDRDPESQNRQRRPHQKAQFEVDVAEQPVEQRIWRMQSFRDREQLGEHRECDRLEAQQNRNGGIKHRVHVEDYVANSARLRQQPRPHQRTDKHQSQPGI